MKNKLDPKRKLFVNSCGPAFVRGGGRDILECMICDKNKNFINKNSLDVRRIDLNNVDKTYINETAVIIPSGDIGYCAFGHIIPAVCHFLWYLFDDRYKNLKTMKIVLLLGNQNKKFLDFLYLLVPKEQFIMIEDKNKIYQFKEAFVADSSFGWNGPGNDINNKFVDIFDKMKQNVPDKYNYEKIYFTRSEKERPLIPNSEATKIVYNEKQIERIFEKNGFKIFYPDKLSIMEQIAICKKAKVLAAVSGAALQQAVFLPNNSTVIALCRDYVREEIAFQIPIDRLKNNTSIYIDACVNPLPFRLKANWSHNTIIGVNRHVKAFFDDYKFKYNNEDLMPNKDEMLNFLIDFGYNYSNYKDKNYRIKKLYDDMESQNTNERLSKIEEKLKIINNKKTHYKKHYKLWKMYANLVCIFIINKEKRHEMRINLTML